MAIYLHPRVKFIQWLSTFNAQTSKYKMCSSFFALRTFCYIFKYMYFTISLLSNHNQLFNDHNNKINVFP